MDGALRLNPNCCYQACPGCKSVLRLAEFQSRHSTDWPDRLRGPARLVGAVTAGWTPAAARLEASGRCVECGGFDAVDFADTWICPDCCSARGACCAGQEL
jgi:hypothetical protein